MSRITEKFGDLSKKREGSLIIYVTAGDPSLESTRKILRTISKYADIIELGIPFSDPIADGPTIQAASERSLRGGTNPDRVFKIISDFRGESDLPIVVLTYYNIMFQRGIDKFMKDLADAGGNGVIVPDLPIEESDDVRWSGIKHGIDVIPLVAPTSPSERIRRISEVASGFIYLVSLLGVTGAREKLSDFVGVLTRRVSKESGRRIPIAIGFGLSKPEHVKEVIRSGADGAIVGSALVKIIEKFRDNERRMLREIDDFLASLKSATKAQ